jgi:hypothetical protein
MEPGAVIRLTHFQHHHRAAQISATYKAPKGKVFVALVLGVEEKDGSQEFDPNRALESLGWRFEGGEAGR